VAGTETETPKTIEWHRVDAVRGARGLLIWAALLITVGATLVGAAFVQRISPGVRPTITLFGAAMMLAGLVIGIGGMGLLLTTDAHITLRTDGVLLHTGREETLLAWSDIRMARTDHEKLRVVFDGEAGETLATFYAGKSAISLAARIEKLRQRARLGVLTAG
jgi:hypothetical protein